MYSVVNKKRMINPANVHMYLFATRTIYDMTPSWRLHTLWPKENISNKTFYATYFSSNEIAHMCPSMPTMDTQIH